MSDRPIAGAGRPKMQWYPLYVDDFDLDTRTWPLDVVGALIRLMNHQWREGYLPANQEKLARIAGSFDAEQWREIWKDYLIVKFTELEPGKLFNNRLHRERIRIEKKGEQARQAALTRWNKQTKDAEPHAGEMRPHQKSDALAMRTKNQEQRDQQTPSPAVRVARGDVPFQKIVDLYHEHCPQLPRVKVLSAKRKAQLRSRWKTFEYWKGFGRPGTKEYIRFNELEQWERYFKFITEKCPFLNGKNDRGWVANFDFVIRESGMVNIMENKYVGTKS